MDKLFDWAARNTIWILLTPAAIVFGFTVAVPVYLSFQEVEWGLSHEANGSVGDFIGGVMNPIIALMALIWLVKGVKLQQRELADTKTALMASEKHQAKQVKISAITALLSAKSDEYDKFRVHQAICDEKIQKAQFDYDIAQRIVDAGNDSENFEELYGRLEYLRGDYSIIKQKLEKLASEKGRYVDQLEALLAD